MARPVTLVTGAGSGFGRLIALTFARKGHTVYATLRQPTANHPLLTAAAEERLDLRLLQVELAEQDTIELAVEEALDRSNRIDVLVNNAGRGLAGAVEDVSDAEARAVFEVNMFAPLHLIRRVAPVMRRQGSGAIVNVSSIQGVIAAPFEGVYSASKWALEALTEALYFELKPFGVRVALIEPGRFPTGFEAAKLTAARAGESAYRDLAARFEAARSARLAGAEAPEAAQAVADAAWEAATGDTPRLRWLVGDDAAAIAAVRAAGGFEDYERTMREVLNFWD